MPSYKFSETKGKAQTKTVLTALSTNGCLRKKEVEATILTSSSIQSLDYAKSTGYPSYLSSVQPHMHKEFF